MSAHESAFRLLNSWKEIATYLGRGIRTVQRWEKMGLPVRRIGTGHRSPVVADARDLDRWLQTAHRHGFQPEEAAEPILNLHHSVERSRRLQEELLVLRDSQLRSVARLAETVASITRACSVPLPVAIERSRAQTDAYEFPPVIQAELPPALHR